MELPSSLYFSLLESYWYAKNGAAMLRNWDWGKLIFIYSLCDSGAAISRAKEIIYKKEKNG